MSDDLLAAHQLDNAGQALGALVRHCRDVYVRAASVLDLQTEELAKMREMGIVERINVTPLVPAYEKLCDRYRVTLYDPQIALFPKERETPEAIWWAWYYHELTPQLLGNAHFVRTVLRSMELLYCTDISLARIELAAFLENIPIQISYCHPTWPAPL
jgi:hypothetical protein